MYTRVLVVIDMQNDFIDGPLGTVEAQKIVPRVCERMKEMAEDSSKKTILFFTQDTHDKNYLNTQEGKILPVPHCIRKTKGWYINSGVQEAGNNKGFWVTKNGGEKIIKHTFGSMEIANMISDEANSIDEIVLIGVCTDICVISNAVLFKTLMPETKITVDASCCAGSSPSRHLDALNTMKSCQINVINM